MATDTPKRSDSRKDDDVFADHTAAGERKPGAPLPPGPPDASDVDFKKDDKGAGKGFSSVPGAGPNPTSGVRSSK